MKKETTNMNNSKNPRVKSFNGHDLKCKNELLDYRSIPQLLVKIEEFVKLLRYLEGEIITRRVREVRNKN